MSDGKGALQGRDPHAWACVTVCLLRVVPRDADPFTDRFFFAVVILFKQTGDAPVLKQPKVKVRELELDGKRSLCRTVLGWCRLPVSRKQEPIDCLYALGRWTARSAFPSWWTFCGSDWARTTW